jgi:hypothetical protein
MGNNARGRGVLLVGVLAATLLLAGRGWASDEELLEKVLAGLHHRYTSIASCQGSVHLVTTLPTDEGERLMSVQVLTVAFDGKRLRMSGQVHTGSAVDFEGTFDGEMTTELLAEPSVGVRTYKGLDGVTDGMFSLFVDPRSIGGLPVAGSERDADGSMRIAGREVLDGRECLVLELTGPASRMRVWVDVERGFSVLKYRLWYVRRLPYLGWSTPGGSVLLREEVVELSKYGEGLWGPSTFTRVEYRPDGTVEKKVYGTYTPGFEINVPISEDRFHLALPAGTPAYDERQGAPGMPYTSPQVLVGRP